MTKSNKKKISKAKLGEGLTNKLFFQYILGVSLFNVIFILFSIILVSSVYTKLLVYGICMFLICCWNLLSIRIFYVNFVKK